MINRTRIQLAEMWPIMAEQLELGKKVRFAPMGKSMLPMIRQNEDTVVLKSAPPHLEKYDLPLYRRKNGQFVMHRVVGIAKDGSYIMCGDNQYVREYGITDENILAVAEGYYRGDRYISCSDKDYLQYCRRRVFMQRLRGYKAKIKSVIKRIIGYKTDK